MCTGPVPSVFIQLQTHKKKFTPPARSSPAHAPAALFCACVVLRAFWTYFSVDDTHSQNSVVRSDHAALIPAASSSSSVKTSSPAARFAATATVTLRRCSLASA